VADALEPKGIEDGRGGCGGKVGLLGGSSCTHTKTEFEQLKLYIKLDKRISATLTQLGYPTKNALKTWYREYKQRQDVSLGYARSRLKYLEKQNHLAVDHHLDHGRCITGTIKALGIPLSGHAHLLDR
jgi:hypothetical protein